LIFIHAAILIVGGHYTYAEVPLFNWIRDALGTARNSYDGVGHFAQGFIPAILTREILLRKTPLIRGGWLNLIVVSICLAISALYELIEWWVAIFTGTAADAFLGAQGDPWDTQKDMALAWIGAMLALFLLSRLHDRSMQELEPVARQPVGFAPR
jgi:putative membrane protein